MTIIQEISSKEEFESAVATPDKFVFVYIYDTEIPAAAKERIASNVSKYSTVAPPYAFDITKAPMAKQHLKIEKSPTVLVFKEGKEVERIEEPNAEKMKDLDSLFG